MSNIINFREKRGITLSKLGINNLGVEFVKPSKCIRLSECTLETTGECPSPIRCPKCIEGACDNTCADEVSISASDDDIATKIAMTAIDEIECERCLALVFGGFKNTDPAFVILKETRSMYKLTKDQCVEITKAIVSEYKIRHVMILERNNDMYKFIF